MLFCQITEKFSSQKNCVKINIAIHTKVFLEMQIKLEILGSESFTRWLIGGKVIH